MTTPTTPDECLRFTVRVKEGTSKQYLQNIFGEKNTAHTSKNGCTVSLKFQMKKPFIYHLTFTTKMTFSGSASDTCNETWELNEETAVRFTLITRPAIVGDKLNVDTLKMEVTYTEHDNDVLFHAVSLSPSQRTQYVTGDAFHIDLGKELTTSYCNIQSHSQPLLRRLTEFTA